MSQRKRRFAKIEVEVRVLVNDNVIYVELITILTLFKADFSLLLEGPWEIV